MITALHGKRLKWTPDMKLVSITSPPDLHKAFSELVKFGHTEVGWLSEAEVQNPDAAFVEVGFNMDIIDCPELARAIRWYDTANK